MTVLVLVTFPIAILSTLVILLLPARYGGMRNRILLTNPVYCFHDRGDVDTDLDFAISRIRFVRAYNFRYMERLAGTMTNANNLVVARVQYHDCTIMANRLRPCLSR